MCNENKSQSSIHHIDSMVLIDVDDSNNMISDKNTKSYIHLLSHVVSMTYDIQMYEWKFAHIYFDQWLLS